jgi:hypothetical protein
MIEYGRIICKKKLSDVCLWLVWEYPSLAYPPIGATSQTSLPPNGQVPSGRVFQSEPQHMTDIINLL